MNTYFTDVNPKDSAAVQLVKVPKYTGNVTVTGELTAQNWNGRTGGVLAFEATGTVTLNSNINVDGKGFKGAISQANSIQCKVDTSFYYQSTGLGNAYSYSDPQLRWTANPGGSCNSGCLSNIMDGEDSKQAGYRGEGIVANIFKKTFAGNVTAVFDKGRGRWGNGGGGGGNHNAGGGGGSNYGHGGFGGNAFNNEGQGANCPTGTLTRRRGYGGDTLRANDFKVFMGGGGGEGHANIGGNSQGTNGGGLIFIKATELINSNAFSISANGADNNIAFGGDGLGGGGAGGSILLSIPNYTNTTAISVKGGKGGNHTGSNCHGTGGGGGGGIIKFSTPGVPMSVSVNIAGGLNGIQTNPSYDCGNINWGATAGSIGLATGLPNPNATLFNENICNGAFLPVKMGKFTVDNIGDYVLLEWNTFEEVNNSKFNVERSIDGKTYEIIGSRAAKRTANSNYTFTDYNLPASNIVYYRLNQIDLNGQSELFGPIALSLKKPGSGIISIAPNPVIAGNTIDLKYNSSSSTEATISIYNLFGQIVYNNIMSCEKGYNSFQVETNSIYPGNYLLKITHAETTLVT